MQAAHITADALGAIEEWTELASRENDGLAVSLLKGAISQIKVLVADTKFDDVLELDVPGARALEAFNHPFAYAAARGVCFGDALSESADLLLQS